MADSFIQVAPDGTGKLTRTRNRTVGANSVHEQYVIVQDEAVVSYRGRAGTYRMLGRNGAAGTNQFLATIFNAAGSTVLTRVNRIAIDLLSLVPRAPGVASPLVRVSRITAAPTGGTALVKAPRDSAGVSNASVTLLGDASADGTSSATALAATVTAGSFLTQEMGPRLLQNTGTGATTTTPPIFAYEPADRMEFFVGETDIILRAGEGIALYANNITAAAMPTTDHYIAVIDWDEYTLP